MTIDGKDAGISGDYLKGYTIQGSGKVTVSAVIAVFDITNEKLYYVNSNQKSKEVDFNIASA